MLDLCGGPHITIHSLLSQPGHFLFKAVDIKKFGYATVLAPLLKDLAILEKDGIDISTAGQNVRGSVFCVAANNLGAQFVDL